MKTYVLTAGCKINLGLRITGRREDGYHTLDSIFWPLAAPCDHLHVHWDDTANNSTGLLTLRCTTQGIDLTHNTLTRAHAAYAKATGFAPHLHCELIKGIPQGAGLGGGSSDAAQILLWLNTHLADAPDAKAMGFVPLDATTLRQVALSVGADVPFFCDNKPARVQGIGEILQPLHDNEVPAVLHGAFALVLCPSINISTPWAYAAWDDAQKLQKITPQGLTFSGSKDKELNSGSSCVDTWFFNDFERVVFDAQPALADYKNQLKALGALHSVMTGSGAALVGLFDSVDKAHAAALTFQKHDAYAYVVSLDAGASPSR